MNKNLKPEYMCALVLFCLIFSASAGWSEPAKQLVTPPFGLKLGSSYVDSFEIASKMSTDLYTISRNENWDDVRTPVLKNSQNVKRFSFDAKLLDLDVTVELFFAGTYNRLIAIEIRKPAKDLDRIYAFKYEKNIRDALVSKYGQGDITKNNDSSLIFTVWRDERSNYIVETRTQMFGMTFYNLIYKTDDVETLEQYDEKKQIDVNERAKQL